LVRCVSVETDFERVARASIRLGVCRQHHCEQCPVLVRRIQGLDRHRVLRERPRLVCGDNGHRAERFHSCEAPYNCLARCHPLCAGGECQGENCWKALWNRRKGDRYREQQDVDDRVL
jgi:hypothetical protein